MVPIRMSTWADIQRLASDLQRVQLSEAAKKLSDGNCVEVMVKLIERQMIDVVFTKDGSAYITRKHLKTEIQNECLGLGGRVPLHALSTTLNVDFEHVEQAVHAIVAEDEAFILSNGELFAKDYVNELQSQLRVLLAEHGVRTQGALCRLWDLPTDLLKSLLIDQLPSEGEFIVDGDSIYTKEYLEAHKMLLRAIVSAITKVTPVSSLQNRVSLPPGRFFAALDELIANGEVPGKIVGSRNSASATYVPNLHGELINAAVKRMLAQEDYIQLSHVKKMGVSDAKAVLKGALPPKEFESLVFLPTIVLGKEVVQQQITEVKEEVEKSKFANVLDLIQKSGIPFENDDADYFVTKTAKENKEWYLDGVFVFTKDLLSKAIESIGDKLDERAEKEVESAAQKKKQPQQQSDDWDDGKKGGKKGKGGKGGKGKSAPKGGNESAGEEASSAVLSTEICDWLSESDVIPSELCDAVAEAVADHVSSLIRDRVAKLQLAAATTSAQSHKRSHQQMQQSVAQLYGNICMFEGALEKVSDPLATDLRGFLQKTLCTELAHAVLSFVSGTPNVGQMKDKQRDETITNLPSTIKDALTALYASLKAEGLQSFHDAMFDVSSPSVCALNVKNPDKKTKADLTATYCAALLVQVNEQEDPAACLLSAVMYLLTKQNIPVHASGKFVSQLVPMLATEIDVEIYDLLTDTQKLVVASFKNKQDEELKQELDEKLNELRQKLNAQ